MLRLSVLPRQVFRYFHDLLLATVHDKLFWRYVKCHTGFGTRRRCGSKFIVARTNAKRLIGLCINHPNDLSILQDLDMNIGILGLDRNFTLVGRNSNDLRAKHVSAPTQQPQRNHCRDRAKEATARGSSRWLLHAGSLGVRCRCRFVAIDLYRPS